MNIHAGVHLDGNESVEIENNICEEDKHEYFTLSFNYGALTIFCPKEMMKKIHEELSKSLYDELTYEELEDKLAELRIENDRLKEENYYLNQLREERVGIR